MGIIRFDGSTSWWHFSTSYSPRMVDWLRSQVPSYFKRWNPVEKVWTLGAHHGLKFLNFLHTDRYTTTEPGLNSVMVEHAAGHPDYAVVPVAYINPVWAKLKTFERDFSSESPQVLRGQYADAFYLIQEQLPFMKPFVNPFQVVEEEYSIGASKVYSKGGGIDIVGAFGSTKYLPNSAFFTQRALWEWFEGGVQKQSSIELKLDATNAFEFFGLDISATDQDISAAYKAAVFKTHPDRGGSAEHFIKVREMHEQLRNPMYRKRIALALKLAPDSPKVIEKAPIPKTIYHPPFTFGKISFTGVSVPGGLFALQIHNWQF